MSELVAERVRPAGQLKPAVLMGLVQFLNYTNLVINYRAVAHGIIWAAVLSDIVAVLVSYYVIRRVANAQGPWTLFAMVIGGAAASWFGIWPTEAWQP